MTSPPSFAVNSFTRSVTFGRSSSGSDGTSESRASAAAAPMASDFSLATSDPKWLPRVFSQPGPSGCGGGGATEGSGPLEV
jgi:hypothetical protein